MLKRYQETVGSGLRLLDAIVIGVAWLISYWIRFETPLIRVTKGFPEFKTYAALTPLLMVLWVLIFSSFGLYRSKTLMRRTDEAILTVKGHLVAILVFLALSYLFSEYRYSRIVVAWFGILSGIGLVTMRLGIRNFIRSLRVKGIQQRNAIIIGEGPSAETLAWRLDRFPELGLRVVGFLARKESDCQSIWKKRRLGNFEDLIKVLGAHRIDHVLIALPRNQSADLDLLLSTLRHETIGIQIIPDLHEYVALGCHVEDFDGLPVLSVNDSPLQGWGALAKRFTDIVVSGLALVILFPFFALIGFLVWLTSPGPIFFTQERMGLDGRVFKMLKFRTMSVDAEVSTGAVWAKPEDGRRTMLGKALRSTSLDELPQLWNIFKGEMSLVGPRPERPVFVEKFKDDVPHYMLRHKVKSGLTGWAQVNGWRGNTSLEKRIECDLYYIRNWSYTFDLKIVWKTLWNLNRNAY